MTTSTIIADIQAEISERNEIYDAAEARGYWEDGEIGRMMMTRDEHDLEAADHYVDPND